jgi:hypothetical protein
MSNFRPSLLYSRAGVLAFWRLDENTALCAYTNVLFLGFAHIKNLGIKKTGKSVGMGN